MDVDVTFESGGQPYPEGYDWRPISAYEASLVELLLSASIGERPVVPDRVRALDECRCVEFDAGQPEGPVTILAEAFVPPDHACYPLEVMLSVRGAKVCWLEFHRYGQNRGCRPPAEEFEISARNVG